MTIYCLYSRPDGATKVVPICLREPATDPARLMIPTGVGASLMTGRRERQGQWHTTPTLGVTVIVEGCLDIEINKAAPQGVTLVAGDILLVLDATGDGHRSRAHGANGMSALLLPLDAADLPSLARLFHDWPTDLTI